MPERKQQLAAAATTKYLSKYWGFYFYNSNFYGTHISNAGL